MRFFTLKIFSTKVNSLDYPEVQQFKYLPESIGKTFDSNSATFKIENGVVAFNYDKEDSDYSIYENISDVIGVHPKLFDTQNGVGEYIKWLNWSSAIKNRITPAKNPVHLRSLNLSMKIKLSINLKNPNSSMRLALTKYDRYLYMEGQRVRMNFLSPWTFIAQPPLIDRFSWFSFFSERICPIPATNQWVSQKPVRVNPSPVMEDKGENAYLPVTKFKIDSTPPPQEQLSTPKIIGSVDRRINYENIIKTLRNSIFLTNRVMAFYSKIIRCATNKLFKKSLLCIS